ncbi:hypothetical protein GCM10029992_22250 [Glycomyces albus]
MAGREGLDLGDGAVADAPLGDVDHALGRDGVVGVDRQLEVGQQVADLLALIEADAADDLVGDAAAHEDFLEGAGLGVGAVEDGDVAEGGLPGVDQLVDAGGDPGGLVVLVVAGVAEDPGPVAEVGEQLLLPAAGGVVLDDVVGRVEDVLGGAVVLLQQDGLGLGVVALELDDIADGGAAEGVDGLVGVADHAELGGLVAGADQLADERVLGVVGVLVLVDHDVAEAHPVRGGDLGEVAEQADGGADDVVEVDRAGQAEPLVVLGVDVGHQAGPGIVGFACGLGGPDQFVLEPGDLGGQPARGLLLGVQAQFLDDLGEQAAGVVGVVDGEARLPAEPVGLAAQDAQARGVEGHDPHGPGAGADEIGDALAHLGGGLVGEGDRQDLAGMDVALGQQVADPVGQDAGLPRARAGDDEQRRSGVLDGLSLRFVEAGHEGFGSVVHRAQVCRSLRGIPDSAAPRRRSRRAGYDTPPARHAAP